MEWFHSVLAILTGLFVRLAIPLVITLLAIYILHKVDVRWQEEAAHEPSPVVEKPNCWETKNCTAEQMRECPVPNAPEPCWQVRRLPNGYLRPECLDCQVFHHAPIPTFAHT